jgi:hypothetical protein
MKSELSSASDCIPGWAIDLEARLERNQLTTTDRLWLEPHQVMSSAGMQADPWQQEVLTSPAPRLQICCSRQAGKSLVVAALAVLTALLEPPAMILILSRSLRQSGELFRKVKGLYRSLANPTRAPRLTRFVPKPVKDLERLESQEMFGPEGAAVQESALQMELANGSRIISLPGSADTIVGFSGVTLLIIDEASRVSDAVYKATRPMLAVSKGRLVLLSSPFGKRGFFYDEWIGQAAWHRIRITAHQCPRISAEFLEEERAALGDRWYRQEYECSFEETVDAVFDYGSIQRAMVPSCGEPPLF